MNSIKNRDRELFELDYNYCPKCAHKLRFTLHADNRLLLTCPSCSFIFYNNPTAVVSGLLLHNHQVLMIQRNSQVYNHYWCLPGGVINHSESPQKALTREYYEETNLKVKVKAILDAYLITYAPNGPTNKPSHSSIDICYQVQSASETINIPQHLSPEIIAIDWFKLNHLPKKIAFEHQRLITQFSKGQ